MEWITSNAYLARSVLDWVSLGALVVVTSVMRPGQLGFRQQFSLNDTSIQHPYVDTARTYPAMPSTSVFPTRCSSHSACLSPSSACSSSLSRTIGRGRG